MAKGWECKYCDSPSSSQYPGEIDGFRVCDGCGAEWSACKVEVEFEEEEEDLDWLN